MEKGESTVAGGACAVSVWARRISKLMSKNAVTRGSACGTSRRVHLIPDRRLERHDMGNKRLVQLVLAASVFEFGGTFAATPFALFHPTFNLAHRLPKAERKLQVTPCKPKLASGSADGRVHLSGRKSRQQPLINLCRA